jgi:hypothetical protein
VLTGAEHACSPTRFLLHRQWEPYDKWREATLPGAADLAGPLRAAVTGADWWDREAGLAAGIELLMAVQRRRCLPAPDPALAAAYRAWLDTT